MAKVPMEPKENRYDEILEMISKMASDLNEADKPISMFAIVCAEHPDGGFLNRYYYLSQLEIRSLLDMSIKDFNFIPVKERKDDCE